MRALWQVGQALAAIVSLIAYLKSDIETGRYFSLLTLLFVIAANTEDS